jgi:hypothetical protein
MPVWWILSATVVLVSGCMTPAPPASVVQERQSASPTPAARRISGDGTGGFILPDGTRVEGDQAGGFTLPNGAYVASDGQGGLRLPNGTRCSADGAGGYICS